MDRYEYETVKLSAMTCGKCGITFAVPDKWIDARRSDGETFYCPNGDPRVYRETTEDRLRRQLESARAREVAARDQREAAERSLIATRGHLTRAKKRAAAGVCQHCNRTFSNYADHMRTKHPHEAATAHAPAPKAPPAPKLSKAELLDRALLAALTAAGGEIADREGRATTRLYDTVTEQVDASREYASLRLGALERDEGLVGREKRGPYVYRVWLTDAGRERVVVPSA